MKNKFAKLIISIGSAGFLFIASPLVCEAELTVLPIESLNEGFFIGTNMIKLCECGCGQSTKIITQTSNKRGRIKGEYNRFLNGHATRKESFKDFKQRVGDRFCECGCGQKIIIKPYQRYAGIPHFIYAHNLRTKKAKERNRNIRRTEIGKRNHNWKGGITPLYMQIRNLDESKQWRSDVFKRDNWICQTCGLHSGEGKAIYLEAHHIKPFIILYEEFLKEYNQFSEDKDILVKLATKWKPFWEAEGITLCKDCHNLTKKGRGKYV